MPWQCRMTMRTYYWNNLHHQHQSVSVWPSSWSQSFRVHSSSRSLSTSTDHRIVPAGKKQHLPPIGHINFRQAPKNFQVDMWATHTCIYIICYIQDIFIFWWGPPTQQTPIVNGGSSCMGPLTLLLIVRSSLQPCTGHLASRLLKVPKCHGWKDHGKILRKHHGNSAVSHGFF